MPPLFRNDALGQFQILSLFQGERHSIQQCTVRWIIQTAGLCDHRRNTSKRRVDRISRIQIVVFFFIGTNGVCPRFNIPSHAEHPRVLCGIVGDGVLRHIIAIRPGKTEISPFLQLDNGRIFMPFSADLLLLFLVCLTLSAWVR